MPRPSFRMRTFFLAVVLLLLLCALPTLAGEVPPGQNSVTILVSLEDPAAPGTFVPGENIKLAYKFSRVSQTPSFVTTDAQGQAVITQVPDGMLVVYFDLDSLPEGYLKDEYAVYLSPDNLNRDLSAHMRLQLSLPFMDGETAQRGGLRLQKNFYPYPLESFLGTLALPELMVYQGEQVAGAGFIVYRYTDDWTQKLYYNQDQGFVPDRDLATVLYSDTQGQVALLGLTPGFYYATEVTPLAGCRLPANQEDLTFHVQENTVHNQHSPVTNSLDAFSLVVLKQESLDPAALPVPGARFLVYRESGGTKEYLFYRWPIAPGGPILPAFTTDRALAHEFISGEMGGTDQSFALLLGLPRHHEITGEETAYFLEESFTPPGYQAFLGPVALTPDYSDPNPENNTLVLVNERQPDTLLVHKSIQDPQSSHPGYARNLAGASFLLFLQEPVAQNPSELDLRPYVGVQEGIAQFVSPIRVTQDSIDYTQLVQSALSSGAVEKTTQPDTGMADFPGRLMEGDYLVVESKAPFGFVLDYEGGQSFQTFTLQKNAQGETQPNPRLSFENAPPEGTLLFQKTDFSGRLPLPGAEFVLLVQKMHRITGQTTPYYLAAPLEEGFVLTEQMDQAHHFTTNENGMLAFSGLEYMDGDYFFYYSLVETKAPEGYLLPSEDRRNSATVWGFPAFLEGRNQGPLPLPFSLKTKKTLEGQQLKDGQFAFELFARDGSGNITPLATTTNRANGEVLFEQVWLTHPLSGETDLVIKEIIPPPFEQGNYEYDTRECVQRVAFVVLPPPVGQERQQVGTRQNGETILSMVDIALSFLGGVQPGDCGFVNHVKPDKPPATPTYPTIRVPLLAEKTLKNGRLKGGDFTFVLRDSQGQEIARAQNGPDGSVVFPERTFSREVSNYRYTVSELAGTDKNIRYDPTIYTVKVTTRAISGVLTAQVELEKDGVPYSGKLAFTNVKKAPATGDQTFSHLMITLLFALFLSGAAWVLHLKRKAR